MPKAYESLLRAMNSPTSRLVTFDRDAKDYSDVTSPKFCGGYTLAQLTEIRVRNPTLYKSIMSKEDVTELLHDSAFD